MVAETLEALPSVLGCAGAAVLEIPPDGPPDILHRHGADARPLLPLLRPWLHLAEASFRDSPAGERLALLPPPHRLAPRQLLFTWRPAGGRPFDPDDRHMLAAAADLLFVLMGNQTLQRELERQARTDPLTGLLNRRAFLDDLNRRLERLSMTPGPARGALFFIDLDNFKALNDREGHEAGDAALIAVANLLREMVRPGDLVARLGGDEFALWIDPADADLAALRAQALCHAAVIALPMVLPVMPIPITFSIGGAVHAADAPEPPEALVARADTAMYAAKRAGRNGWRLAPQGG
jgi:diguanylate cyclase (GGDEF)-like protein